MIADNGQILAQGINTARGASDLLVLTPLTAATPEGGTLGLMGLGLLVVFAWRRADKAPVQ